MKVQHKYADRYTSDDLLALAKEEHVLMSERVLHDLPMWGLLPLATTEGRAPREGVGRYWTREQAIVFHVQLKARAAGTTGRGHLANIPVAAWLLEGESWVPLTQLRRALRTWLRWRQNLARRSRERVALHTLKRRPDVEVALASGAITSAELVAEARAVPLDSHDAASADFFGRVRGPLGERLSPAEQARRIDNRARSDRALEKGIVALPSSTDELLRETRKLYCANLAPLLDQQSDSEAAARLFSKLELSAACANALTVLGKIIEDREQEDAVRRFVEVGVRAAFQMGDLLNRIETARQTSSDSIALSNRNHARRMGKRHPPSSTRHKRLE